MHGFHIGRVRGIDLRIHWSVLVIYWLVGSSLATSVFPDAAPGSSDAAYWAAGIASATVFLATLVAHELGHSVIAQRNRVTVDSVTLWFLGGVASLGSAPDNPGSALRIAAAGPAVSGVLAAAFIATSGVLGQIGIDQLVVESLLWIGSINLVLAIFNLLPAFPLDGGRIYHAWVWARERDVDIATRRAAALGHRLGTALVVLGVIEAVTLSAISGLWLAMIGWFIREAGQAEARGTQLTALLEGFQVDDVMTPEPVSIPGTWTIQEFVTHHVSTGRHASYPVLDAGGRLVGLIGLAEVRRLPVERWATTPVSNAAQALERVPVVAPGDGLPKLSVALGPSNASRALVMESGRLVGIVAPSDLARLVVSLQAMAEIDPQSGGQSTGGARRASRFRSDRKDPT